MAALQSRGSETIDQMLQLWTFECQGWAGSRRLDLSPRTNFPRPTAEQLRAGASGFLLKDSAPVELIAAVRAVAAGEGWLDPTITRQLIEEFASRPDTNLPPPESVSALTTRETQVLVLMAHGLTNDEIALHLTVELATVKTHASRVLMKLGVHTRAQAVAVAYRSRLVGPDDTLPRRGAY
jgi:DNA-binding NarL/FixJ family response regulator